MSGTLVYAIENDLDTDEFVDVLIRSTLAERRLAKERARIETMLRNANLIVTVRDCEGCLVGVSRCLTDFAFCCYCSDLAVDESRQGEGVGRRLIEESARAAGPYAHFFLLSAPKAEGFYERIGMVRHPACFERADWKRFDDGAGAG
ncbi:GNAT family N-acetyltransferase [Amphiplicatus metriothermophilus]|uniref:Acetyltransferase (GNAT) domain-containing protein n=1 Tax=Amphiplicatus metriothermophilus TaxID=1519374 RepID=A0A239PQE9_9PROT|nr:GNAT family N-acetyltransferase [Amphiplicatus metriothermophilus]MBB5518491.1 GNAT superfamily N-acetyltransferase [Amphiplicatus metriothermophilus]SNT72348.1 Acetyltransferase (GNAT) domain-containing protein [Amphiplicatus metriothermophilus]